MRVRVAYASVNPADCKARRGMLDKYINYQFPFVLGFDLAGTIDAISADVTRFAVGDAVFGTSRQGQGANGSYAEYSIADEAMLQFISAGLSLAEAASLPTAGVPAIGGLLDVGELKTGQTVLINGGAGGVGSMAIQIANAIGARVLTTCSAGNADYVRGLGADAVIDYRSSDVVAEVCKLSPGGVDLVLDAVGLDTILPYARNLVRAGGSFVEIETLISSASEAQVSPAAAADIRIVSNMIAITNLPRQLTRLAQFVAEGTVKASLNIILPLDKAAEAHRRVGEGLVRGKIALEVAACSSMVEKCNSSYGRVLARTRSPALEGGTRPKTYPGCSAPKTNFSKSSASTKSDLADRQATRP